MRVSNCLTIINGDSMSNLPLPTDFIDEDKKEKLLKSKELSEALDKMPQKQANLIIASLVYPNASKFELARKAGYKVTEGSKPNHLFKPIEGKLGKALLRFGITEADIVRKLFEGANATKTTVVKKTKQDKDGNKSSEHELIESPDFATRFRYIEMLIKLGDYFPEQKIKIDKKSEHVHKFAQNMSLEEMRQKEKELQEIEANYEVGDNGEPIN